MDGGIRIKSFSFTRTLAVLYIIVWSISPPLEIDMIYRLLALGSVGIWALSVLREGYHIGKLQVYAIIFAIAAATIAFIEKGTLDGVLQQIAIYILVSCVLINAFYKGRWEELRIVVPIVLVLLTIYNGRTASVLIEDPTIARRLVRADESVYQYLRQGVGGYSLIYPQVCIFPAIVAWIMKSFRRNNVCFLLGCIWLVSYGACLANAGYSIAIFTSIASVIILIFYRGKSAVAAFLLMGLIFFVGLGAILYFDGLREFLLQFFEGTAVAKKIEDLLLSIQGGAAEGAIYDRITAYKGSINAILDHPLIGGLWRRSGGGHSALLDAFAKYGILGGVIYIKMIFHVPNEYKIRFDHPYIVSISNAVIVAVLFVALMNSFPYSFMGMILLVLPLLYEDIIRWEELEE